MKKAFRLLGAASLTLIVTLFATLHAVGYREAWARVEDLVTTFRPGVPGAFEPYGLNTLLKTTQVRAGDAVYQLSFSSTSASPDQVITSYARTLPGPELTETTGDGQVHSLYHTDGVARTAIRAMPRTPHSGETIVQKLYTVKAGQQAPRGLSDSTAELMPLVQQILREAPTTAEGRAQTGSLLMQAAALAEQQTRETTRHTLPQADRPGFDLPDVPRYPGAVRVSAFALDEGQVCVVRYLADAEAGLLLQFYRKELEAAGWKSDAVSALAARRNQDVEERSLWFLREGRSLHLIAMPSARAQSTSITVMVQ